MGGVGRGVVGDEEEVEDDEGAVQQEQSPRELGLAHLLLAGGGGGHRDDGRLGEGVTCTTSTYRGKKNTPILGCSKVF